MVLRSVLVTCSFTVLTLAPEQAAAHIGLSAPAARVTDSGGGGPCGSGTGSDEFSPTPEAYLAGESITVVWREVVPHPGSVYRITLAAFDSIPDAFNDPDGTLAGGILLAGEIPDEADDEYEVEVTLPNEICEACTIQVVQAGSASYYQCADITIGVTPPDGVGGALGSGGSGTGGSNAGGSAEVGGSETGGSGVGGSITDGSDTDDDLEGGCAYGKNAGPGSSNTWALALVGLISIWRRRSVRTQGTQRP